MPLYEYHCGKCGRGATKLQRYDDPPPECCGKPMTKLISRTNFALKGGGWYRDGYQKEKESS